MFAPGRWAAAFVNSLAAQGGEEEGLNAFRELASWVKTLPSVLGPGAVSGSSAAEKLEKLIREGMAKTRDSAELMNSDPALEIALRFLILMVKKNMIRHIDSVIEETKKILDKKNGIVQVSLEYASPPGDESRIKEAIKKRTGAVGVELEGRVNPELIGGYRLQIGDEIIDASVRSQLRKLETCLTAGIGGGGN